MTNFHWDELLSQWGQVLLSSDNLLPYLPPGAVDVQRGKAGYPGASQAQIKKAETRLGVSLPPSYCAFLQVSNGWPTSGLLVDGLLPVEEIDWFAARSRDWLEAWKLGRHYFGEPPPVKDADYFVYGKAQNPLLIREEYLEAGLQISEGDNAVYLLNPKVIFEDGEWEAWFFESELGAQRYRSFWELMQAEYRKVKDRVEEEKEHARSASAPGGLWAILPSLLTLFQKEIAEQSQLASGAAMGVDRQYVRGIIEGLQYGEQQVRQIQEQARAPGEARRALEALAGELENRWQQDHQAAKQQGEMDLLGQMRLRSFAEGSRQAMGMVQWFLKEHKAP